MNDNAFQALIDLVNFDQKTVFLLKEINIIEKEIYDLKEKQNTLESEINTAKYEIKELQKEVDRGELEMRELEQEEKKKKIRLDNSQSQKEYISLKREIDNLQKMQHDMEGPLLTTWNKLETAKQAFKTKEEEYDKQTQEFVHLITEKEKKIAQLQADLQEHKTHRGEKERKVKKEWLDKYSVMRTKVANPVVEVTGGSCSACFYTITNQYLQELKKNKVVQCKGCYRFLYLKPDQE